MGRGNGGFLPAGGYFWEVKMKSYFKRIAAFFLCAAIALSVQTGFAMSSNGRRVTQTIQKDVQKQSWREAVLASLESPLFSSVPYLKDVPFLSVAVEDDGFVFTKLKAIKAAGFLALWLRSKEDVGIRMDGFFTATDLVEGLLKAKNSEECVAALGNASTHLCVSLAVEGSKVHYPFTQIRFIKWLSDRCPTLISDISSHVVRYGSISAVAGAVLSVPYNVGYKFAQWRSKK